MAEIYYDWLHPIQYVFFSPIVKIILTGAALAGSILSVSVPFIFSWKTNLFYVFSLTDLRAHDESVSYPGIQTSKCKM